jgi:hypothetical protein
MAKVVGDIAVKVSADIGALQKGLRSGAKSVDGFGDRAAQMSMRVAKAGAVVAGALSVAAIGGYNLAKSAADAGAEIERMSRLAGVTPERFQRMAAASKTVGIEQDKLADILKDVSDRVGDFLSTGGGPMKDFFENIAPKVGVTAEQFRNLNSADALQLFISSLEKANISSNEMTFYMEAMASDMTALLPLLTNGGAEMKRFGDEAAAAGAILSNDAVKGSADLQAELENLTKSINTQFTQAILDNKEEISALVDSITDTWIPALIKVAEAMGKVLEVINASIEGYGNWKRLITTGSTEQSIFDKDPSLEGAGGDGRKSPSQIFQGLGINTGPSIADEFGGFVGGGGDTDVDGGEGADTLGFMSDASARAIEIEMEKQARLAEVLQEGFANRLNLLSEGYGAEEEITQEHAEKMRRIEELTQAQRLGLVQGAFGDLASLMSSENEKLFKIGKAAAIAEATISGYKAAVEAWEKGMEVGGPPVAAAFTAASLARTGSLIAGIASQQIGGAGGGAGAATAGAAGQPAARPVQNIQLDMIGASPSQLQAVQTLVDTMVEANRQGYDLNAIVRAS